MKDGIYFEIFAVKNNTRYNIKIVNTADVSKILVNSVMNGLENIIGFETTARSTEKGGEG